MRKRGDGRLIDRAILLCALMLLTAMWDANATEVVADERGGSMGFVNDYATDEEVERYGLRDIWDRYHSRSKGNYWLGRKPDFTIDRENDTFLMLTAYGAEQDSNWHYFLLWLEGHEINAVLRTSPISSKSLKDRPFLRNWELLELKLPPDLEVPQSQIVETLKKAVTEYGYRGISRQIPETNVTFDF